MKTEKHPWAWYVPQGAEYLFVGTFPPTGRNWSFDFFYPNINNLFWKIIAEINGKKLEHTSGAEAVAERKKLLDKLKAGITDMGSEIRRIKENSSLDENIELVAAMDIFRILDEHPSIRKIIFTSSSGKSSALGWFRKYLKEKEVEMKIKPGKKPIYSSFIYNSREIRVAVIHSPSPRAFISLTFADMCDMYAQEFH